jgi:CubicO group peptidase (beta-lactamase class C family)
LRLAPLVLLSTASVASADIIDDYVRATMAREQIPGLALAIASPNEAAGIRSYGYANLEHRVAVQPVTIFQSGSIGKQFTAAAALLQVEDGKLGLDDSIARYLPGNNARWQKITVRHLLTHTSGLPDYETSAGTTLDLRRDYSEDELLQWAMGLELDFEPGTRWAYSNTGYVVLGTLIRKVSGKFYGDVLRERIFGPAGMSTARVISEADLVPNRAAGYELVDGAVRNQSWVSPSLNTTADGALYLTAQDFLKWDAALRERRLLKSASYDSMWTPVRLQNGQSYHYGFGWFIGEQRGSPNIEHSGSWQGFQAHISRYVERQLSIIVLCNIDACDATRIAYGVAGIVDAELQLPDPLVAAPDNQPVRTNLLEAALAAWAEGKPHPSMAPAFAVSLDNSARADAMHGAVRKRLAKPHTFQFLAEDDVRKRAIERSGSRVARIVHCGLVVSGDAQALRFYVNDSGQVLDINLDGW